MMPQDVTRWCQNMSQDDVMSQDNVMMSQDDVMLQDDVTRWCQIDSRWDAWVQTTFFYFPSTETTEKEKHIRT